MGMMSKDGNFVELELLDMISKLEKRVSSLESSKKSNIIEYKDYSAEVDISLEDKCLFGKVLNTKHSITFGGFTVEELEEVFHNIVDEIEGEL